MRKKEARKEDLPGKSIDGEGIRLVEPLIHRGNEALTDVLKWLTQEQKEAGK